MFARPDLATYLLQILIPATVESLVCQKEQCTFSNVLEDGLLGKYLVITPQKSKLKNHHRNFCLSKQEVLGNYLSKRQVGRVLAKSLVLPLVLQRRPGRAGSCSRNPCAHHSGPAAAWSPCPPGSQGSRDFSAMIGYGQ